MIQCLEEVVMWLTSTFIKHIPNWEQKCKNAKHQLVAEAQQFGMTYPFHTQTNIPLIYHASFCIAAIIWKGYGVKKNFFF